MFDLKDWDSNCIKDIIKSRDEDSYVIPLYVKIYNKTYDMLELDTIKEYDESSFKVGFGSSTKLLMKNSFMDKYKFEFDFVDKFEHYDYEENKAVSYIIFESYNVDSDVSIIHKQVNLYVDALRVRIKGMCYKNRLPVILDEYGIMDIDYNDWFNEGLYAPHNSDYFNFSYIYN